MARLSSRYAVDHRSLGDEVTERLRMLILSGELRAGRHLVEIELATLMGVSRGPIREALARLEQEGFVEVAPRQGAFVVDLTPDLVKEKYALRRLLEAYAVRKAVELATDEDLGELEDDCNRMERAVAMRDSEGSNRAQHHFHRAILSMARMPTLLRLWDLLGMGFGWVMMLSFSQTSSDGRLGPEGWFDSAASDSVAQHRALVELIRRGDQEQACAAFVQHIDRGEAAVLRALDRAREQWGAPGENAPVA